MEALDQRPSGRKNISYLFYSGPQQLDVVHLHEGGQSTVLSLQIHMPSQAWTEKHVAKWLTPCGPVKLTHKITHQNCHGFCIQITIVTIRMEFLPIVCF